MEKIWKEEVVASPRYYSHICLKNTIQNLSEYSITRKVGVRDS
jgi:hypothetical protein